MGKKIRKGKHPVHKRGPDEPYTTMCGLYEFIHDFLYEVADFPVTCKKCLRSMAARKKERGQ